MRKRGAHKLSKLSRKEEKVHPDGVGETELPREYNLREGLTDKLHVNCGNSVRSPPHCVNKALAYTSSEEYLVSDSVRMARIGFKYP